MASSSFSEVSSVHSIQCLFIIFIKIFISLKILKGLSNFFIRFWPTIETREFQREKKKGIQYLYFSWGIQIKC
jgi:hypothetical protein